MSKGVQKSGFLGTAECVYEPRLSAGVQGVVEAPRATRRGLVATARNFEGRVEGHIRPDKQRESVVQTMMELRNVESSVDRQCGGGTG